MVFARLLWTTATFVAIDAVWLGVLQREKMGRFFRRVNCGKDVRFGIRAGLLGVGAWLALSIALERFVFPAASSRTEATLLAAALGAVIYAVYDLTNLATIRAWTWSFALTDIAWGALLCGLVAYLRYPSSK